MLVGAEATTLSAIWAIWTAKNRTYFDQEVRSENQVLRSIPDKRDLILHSWSSQQCVSQPRFVSWIKPHASEIAIKCDGSLLDAPARAGFGGCLCDDGGN